MKKTLIQTLGMALAMIAQPALAGEDTAKPGYTAEAVITHMIKQAELGASRAICIGTKSECEANQPKPEGFDMMLTFDLDSATILPQAAANLEMVAAALKDERLHAAKFRVEGHTDAYGSDGYNLNLSQERARAVTDFLVAHDVERSRIVALGLGESEPRSNNPFDPENRRVELSLSIE